MRPRRAPGEKDAAPSAPASAPGARARRHLRMPLAFVVGRYFVYVLLGVGLLCGVPIFLFWAFLTSGFVLPANYAAAHVEEVAEGLAAADAFDASELSAAFGYAHLAEDGVTVLGTDLSASGVDAARAAVANPEAARPATADAYPSTYEAVRLADGTWCVLSYNLLPQWASRSMRDSWPDPQTLMTWVVGVNLVLVVVVVALRASRVLTRKMAPLVDAARAVGEQDLDVPVGTSNVAQVDDVLAAMEQMRVSLRASLEEQWAVEARRREEVAALAHDLKTPLTVVRGNAELLLEDAEALPAEDRPLAEAALAASRQADVAVARLVEASRGDAPARREPVEVAAFVAGLRRQAAELVRARGLALAGEPGGDGDGPGCAGGGTEALPDARPLWDADALSRAVMNLVSNACDHATSEVRLSARVRDGALELCVADDGPGFSPAALAHGRERLFTEDAARGGSAGGHLGLGLAIADEVARAHGGTLALANASDGGAVATLTLPLPPSAAADPAAPA